MKKAIRISVMLLAGAALSACSSLNPFSGNSVKPAALQNFTPELNVSTAWTTSVGSAKSGLFTPVVADGVVYAASEDGQLMAIRLDNGQVAWRVKTESKLIAGVAVAADTVAVVDANNRLLAYNSEGKPKWQAAVNSDVTSLPVGSGNSILVRGIDFSVRNFSTIDGSSQWTYSRQLPPLTLRINSPVDVNNARVYAGFPGGRLVGLDLNNGDVVWEGILANPTGTTEIERITDVTGMPVYNFREVCAASFQGKLGCLDGTNGRPVWTVDFSAPNGVSVDERYMIAANELGDLFAFSRAAGRQAWRIENFQRREPTTPVEVGRAVAIGDFEGYVHFIERDTGRTLARVRVGSQAFSGQPIAVDANRVLVQSRSGNLALLRIQ